MEKFDYKTIRLFPYAMLSMLAVRGGCLVFAGLAEVWKDGFANEMLYQSFEGFFLACDVLVYITVLLVWLCIYRLAGSIGYLRYSSAMFIGFVLVRLGVKAASWLFALTMAGLGRKVMVVLLGFLPDIFVFLGVVFVFLSMEERYVKMEKREKASECGRMCRLWVAICMVSVFVVEKLIPLWEMVIGGLGRPAKAMVFPIVLFYWIAIVWISEKIMKFCYECYMYMYNNGR